MRTAPRGPFGGAPDGDTKRVNWRDAHFARRSAAEAVRTRAAVGRERVTPTCEQRHWALRWSCFRERPRE
eukprot:2929104-Pyramimonas_sp.AAC.1